MEKAPADILTIAEVAEYLRVPVSSVYKLAQAGRIPATRIGRHWRFHRPTLERWFTEQVEVVGDISGKGEVRDAK